MYFIVLQCVKSKSVTNLAEATADPAIDLDPVVDAVRVAVVDAMSVAVVDAVPVPLVEPEGGALIGGVLGEVGDAQIEHAEEHAPS